MSTKKKTTIKDFFIATIMHNTGYKILSILLSVMAWFIIINIADPVITRNFSGLEVEVRNQNAITSINQIYEIVEGNTVDFTVKGKASVVKNLKLSDFSAYADLSQLSPVFAADIKVQCSRSDSIEIDTNNKMMIVKLEDIGSKNVQVTVEQMGEVADGYYVDDFEVKPNMITVSGAASRIAALETIKIAVNVDGAKKNFSTELEPVAYDKDGNKIDSKYLNFTNSNTPVEKVGIDVTVYKTKTIPLILDISGEPKEGHQYNNDYEFTPQTITIGGASKILNKIDSLTIPVDITDAEGEYEVNISLESYLPEDVKLVSNEKEVSVRVNLEELLIRTISFTPDNIKLTNVPDGMKAEFADEGVSLNIQIRGTREEIDKYDSDSIGAYIDLKGKQVGSYYIQPECKNIPDDMYVTRPGTVKLDIVDKNAATDSPEPTDHDADDDEHSIEPTATADLSPATDNPSDESEGNDEE